MEILKVRKMYNQESYEDIIWDLLEVPTLKNQSMLITLDNDFRGLENVLVLD